MDKNGNAVKEPFGNGMNLDYNMFLWSESEDANGTLTSVDVILANGARIFCGCSGSSCTPGGSPFECKATPSQTFFGATIQYQSSPQGWVLTTKDQTKYAFTYYAPTTGYGTLLQSITDRYGNQISLTRNTAGDITKIASSNGRYINLYYQTINGNDVIQRATDNMSRIHRLFVYDLRERQHLDDAVHRSRWLTHRLRLVHSGGHRIDYAQSRRRCGRPDEVIGDRLHCFRQRVPVHLSDAACKPRLLPDCLHHERQPGVARRHLRSENVSRGI